MLGKLKGISLTGSVKARNRASQASHRSPCQRAKAVFRGDLSKMFADRNPWRWGRVCPKSKLFVVSLYIIWGITNFGGTCVFPLIATHHLLLVNRNRSPCFYMCHFEISSGNPLIFNSFTAMAPAHESMKELISHSIQSNLSQIPSPKQCLERPPHPPSPPQLAWELSPKTSAALFFL